MPASRAEGPGGNQGEGGANDLLDGAHGGKGDVTIVSEQKPVEQGWQSNCLSREGEGEKERDARKVGSGGGWIGGSRGYL